MKKIFAIISLLFIFSQLNGQSYIEIGNGTVSSSYPPYTVFKYGWYSFILPQSSIGGAKTITKLSFNCNNGPQNFTNQKIYIKHTSQTIFANANYEDPTNNGYTLVFDGSINYDGWTIIDLSTPFEYNGTDNIIIHYENYFGTVTYKNFYSTTSTQNDNKASGSDVSFPTGSGYLNPYPSSIPNIRLYYASTMPATPDVVSPQNNANKVDLNTSLVFTLGANTTSYDLYLSTNQTEVDNLEANAKVASDVAISGSGQYSYTPSNILTPSTDYYWKVVAKDGSNTTQGTTWKFTTQNVISSFPYNQGFEGDDVFYPGWYGYYTDWTYPTTGIDMIWNKSGVANAHSGQAGLAGAPYSGNAINSAIMTPRIFLPANHRVSYYWRQGNYNTKNAKDGTSTIYFEITTDGGQNWTVLEQLQTSTAQQEFTYIQKDLSSYAGNNVYLRWRYERTGTENTHPVFIDDILIEQIPSGALLSLSQDSVTFANIALNAHNKKTVTLTNLGTQDLVISSIDVSTPFSATVQNTTIAPSSSTILEITYNGSSVGNHTATLTINSNATGNNTVTLNGQTLALLSSIYETFESVTVDELPTNWGVIRNISDNFCNANVKSSASDAHSGTNVVKMLNANTINQPLIMLTPGVSGFDNHTLTFYAKKTQGNANQVDLKIGLMDDPEDTTTFELVQTITITDVSTQYTVTFNSSNTKPYIAFSHGLLHTWESIWIDDVQWEGGAVNPPSCANVVFPQDGAVDLTSDLTMSWTPTSGNVTGYILNVGTSASNPTDALDHEDVGNAEQYAVTNLPYSTTIYWQVIPYNTNGQATGCPVWSYTTMDDPTLNVPWTQGFEDLIPGSGLQYPLGWTLINGNEPSTSWDAIANSSGYPDNAHTGDKAINIAFGFLQSLNDWLITPPINFETNKSYIISFWVKAPPYTGGGDPTTEKLMVCIGTTNNPTDLLQGQIWNNDQLSLNEYTYQEIQIDGLDAGQYYLGFYAYSDPMMWIIFVDDVAMDFVADDNKNKIENVTLYPNPTSQFINIMNKNNFSSIEIINVNGQKIAKHIINQGFNRIDVGNLTNGIYTIIFRDNNNNSQILKFIKN